MEVKKQIFGRVGTGKKVYLYTISNGRLSFSVTNYGCIITSILAPSASDSLCKGKQDDIVLGYSTLDGYLQDSSTYFGALVGRVANRMANAQFTLHEKEYKLDANNGTHTLHGGFSGYNRMVWKSKAVRTKNSAGVSFWRTSPDGEQGFPGKVKIEVRYILTNENEIIMQYRAKTRADTPLNLTNHSYYNLAGQGKGDILSHGMHINADAYLPVNEELIPTGIIKPVAETAFDFRTEKPISKDFATVGGYDHCFCLNKGGKDMHMCAEVTEKTSKRKMTVYTNQPGVQFYSGNFLDIASGKNGMSYKENTGFCLETQQYPNAPNQKDFPSCILHSGELYESITIHKFDVY